MAKPDIKIEMLSYGIYDCWNRASRILPKIMKHTHTVPARTDIEFGYILNIKKARGKKLLFSIDHPPFLDSTDRVSPPFDGEVYVRSNDWNFYLGDSIWEPVQDKIGIWRLTVDVDGKRVADESFHIVEDTGREN